MGLKDYSNLLFSHIIETLDTTNRSHSLQLDVDYIHNLITTYFSKCSRLRESLYVAMSC